MKEPEGTNVTNQKIKEASVEIDSIDDKYYLLFRPEVQRELENRHFTMNQFYRLISTGGSPVSILALIYHTPDARDWEEPSNRRQSDSSVSKVKKLVNRVSIDRLAIMINFDAGFVTLSGTDTAFQGLKENEDAVTKLAKLKGLYLSSKSGLTKTVWNYLEYKTEDKTAGVNVAFYYGPNINQHNIRIEFNPNIVTDNQKEFIQSIIELSDCPPSSSEIDIAWDLNTSLANTDCLTGFSSTRELWTRASQEFPNGTYSLFPVGPEFETAYNGSRQSSNHFMRIYNKKKQVKDTGAQLLDSTTDYRVEVVRSDQQVNRWQEGMHSYEIYLPMDVSNCSAVSLEDWALAKEVFNNPNRLVGQPKKVRAKAKAIIERTTYVSLAEGLNHCLQEALPKLRQTLEDYGLDPDNLHV